MNNPFKNNSLASALLGIIIGIIGFAGYQELQKLRSGVENFIQVDNSSCTRDKSSDSNPPYRGLEPDPDGDVVITKTGNCFHSIYGCSTLGKSSNVRIVDRNMALEAGLSACSKCNP